MIINKKKNRRDNIDSNDIDKTKKLETSQTSRTITDAQERKSIV